MKSLSLTILALAACLAVTSAQVVSRGACPENVKSVETFDVEKYLGTWYEYAKYPAKFEAEGNCVTAQYSLGEGGLVNVKNSLVNQQTDSIEDILGTASLVSPGKLLVKFPVSPAYSVSTNYWVLDTDYENYSVVYSCTPMSDNTHSTFAWILSRDRVPQLSVLEKAVSVLKKNDVSLLELKITNQIACN